MNDWPKCYVFCFWFIFHFVIFNMRGDIYKFETTNTFNCHGTRVKILFPFFFTNHRLTKIWLTRKQGLDWDFSILLLKSLIKDVHGLHNLSVLISISGSDLWTEAATISKFQTLEELELPCKGFLSPAMEVNMLTILLNCLSKMPSF